MKTSFLIIFLISVFYTKAQRTNKPETVEVKTFKLPRFPIADFPKKSISISGIEIMLNIRDSVILGYALKGMDNHVVVLVTEKPPTYFFQEGVNKMYKNDFRSGAANVIWLIKDLRVGEKIGFNQYAYLRINVEAYISKNFVEYLPVCSLDTVFVNESGTDVTAWHGEDIENAFRVLLKQTLANGKEVLQQNNKGIGYEEIKRRSRVQISYPIMNEVYEEGAYANFEEFLQNKPSIKDYRIFSIGKEKQIKFVRIAENNKTDTVNIWGLCKAGEIYKYHQGLLVSIERHRNGFIISNYVEQANRRNNGIFLSSLLGTLGGGIIIGVVAGTVSAAGSDLLLVNSIPYITKAKKQPEATCIDMKTGELSF